MFKTRPHFSHPVTGNLIPAGHLHVSAAGRSLKLNMKKLIILFSVAL